MSAPNKIISNSLEWERVRGQMRLDSPLGPDLGLRYLALVSAVVFGALAYYGFHYAFTSQDSAILNGLCVVGSLFSSFLTLIALSILFFPHSHSSEARFLSELCDTTYVAELIDAIKGWQAAGYSYETIEKFQLNKEKWDLLIKYGIVTRQLGEALFNLSELVAEAAALNKIDINDVPTDNIPLLGMKKDENLQQRIEAIRIFESIRLVDEFCKVT